MKGISTLKKSAVIAAMCLVVLCVSGYSEPTPEQVKERTKLLLQAIENNNVEQAKVCIKLGADVNTKVYYRREGQCLTINRKDIPYYDVRTYTLLIYAVEYNKSKDIIELLAKAGADLNAKNDFDRTALMECASRGHIDMAEILIKAGADVNAKSKDGNTALLYASDIVNFYEKKIEVYRDMVELLVKSGADVNAKNGYGESAIISAARIGVKDVVELLIKAGADVNAKNDGGDTALMYASSKDIAELLIKFGADVNVKDNDGKNALIYAVHNYCWQYGGSNYKDIAEMLIKAGADSGMALVWAVKECDSSAGKLLIELGADVNAKDSDGISVLDNALVYGKNDVADLLRAAGAKE